MKEQIRIQTDSFRENRGEIGRGNGMHEGEMKVGI